MGDSAAYEGAGVPRGRRVELSSKSVGAISADEANPSSGDITSDIGRASVARVVAGAQRQLDRRGYMLALGSFGCASEWNTIPVQLQQRGIEGVIAIDSTLPAEMDLPVASVELEYMALAEPFAEEMKTWLTELGEAAADAILRQIEKDSSPRRMEVIPKLPSSYFDLPDARSGMDARERA